MSETTTIYVCTKCRLSDEAPEPRENRLGARLHRQLAAEAADAPDVVVIPVECLSVCKRPVTIGFGAHGKWTYLYGDFAIDQATAILDAARLYGRAADGLIPWSERPESLKKGVIARLPPVC